MPLPVLFEIAILSILFLRLSMQLDTKEVQTFTKLHFAFNIFTISTKIWLVSFNIRVRILLYIREKCFFLWFSWQFVHNEVLALSSILPVWTVSMVISISLLSWLDMIPHGSNAGSSRIQKIQTAVVIWIWWHGSPVASVLIINTISLSWTSYPSALLSDSASHPVLTFQLSSVPHITVITDVM